MAERNPLTDFPEGTRTPTGLWDGQYKIPWDDPDFSRRMLQEHLSQDHDLASRRSEYIERQVAWLQRHLLAGGRRRILDLGCGPGFYLERLSRRGHTCVGIDFSPASVAYARERLQGDSEVTLGDIRSVEFPAAFDVVMMIYGEFNVFSPGESDSVLRKMYDSLVSGGTLAIEVQIEEAVRKTGQAEKTWYSAERGLFSDEPHLCLIENYWIEQEAAALQCFFVIDVKSNEFVSYRSTTRAWSDEELIGKLSSAGFSDIRSHDDWPMPNDSLKLWTAHK